MPSVEVDWITGAGGRQGWLTVADNISGPPSARPGQDFVGLRKRYNLNRRSYSSVLLMSSSSIASFNIAKPAFLFGPRPGLVATPTQRHHQFHWLWTTPYLGHTTVPLIQSQRVSEARPVVRHIGLEGGVKVSHD